MAKAGTPKRWLMLATPSIAFIAGAVIFGGIAWFLPSPIEGQRFTGGVLYQASDTYPFIDPLLACDIGTQDTFTDLDPMKDAITDVISKEETAGNASSVSVYMLTMRNDHWFDLNAAQTYAPASLLKTFIMMAYLEEARETRDPSTLTREVTYQGTTTPAKDEDGNSIPQLVPGSRHSINDLITQMITYSDNDALTTLVNSGDNKMVQISDQIFSDLKITSPLSEGTQLADFMTVDQYAMVFRVLYSATYLGRTYSEQALSILSKAAFRNGIVAGVPSGTVVAHKYGYSVGQSDAHTTPVELHDCGVVYYPGNPYLLCVMTKGTDLKGLETTIQAVSKEVWGQMGKLSK